MKRLSREFRFLPVLFCAVAFCTAQVALGDTNFPGNVTVSSNLVVNGTASLTNIVPNSASSSVYISGANNSGSTSAGAVVITGGGAGFEAPAGNVVLQGGGGGYQSNGGSIILQGGYATYQSIAGDVILKNMTNLYTGTLNGTDGFVKLQTANGTTRFYLQTDGTLNASSDAIVNIGALNLASVTITNWVQVVAHIGPLGDVSMGSFTNSP
jgi:hypothetical protein